MCGIFGFVSNRRDEITEERLHSLLSTLIKLSERRGNEAGGVLGMLEDRILVYKQAMRPSAMLRTSGFRNFVENITHLDDNNRSTMPIVVIGHTRLVTNGSQALSENNQPINAGHVIGVHNGIVTNDREIVERYKNTEEPLKIQSDSDTEAFFSLVNKYLKGESDIPKALARSYREITGAASIAMLFDIVPALALATNTGSLYYSVQEKDDFFVFGSERHIVKKFLHKYYKTKYINRDGIRQLQPFTIAVLKIGDIAPRIFTFDDALGKAGGFTINVHKKIFDLVDMSYPAKKLRRCTKCVLPESFPFIRFDEEGVCNYCRRYQRQVFKGREAIETILEKYRSKNGEPDCIVGFSGGRDSSYGLHVLKKELGMHPVAFTYDWGMVTDLARRNQAKMTGKLGIEHIILSADIHQKRRYIRKNIYAWLKNPELGMVPIFMSGDKMFYFYGRYLRKELGVKLTIFSCGHQLEQMEFKIGFCGIDQPLVNNQKMYYYDTWVKARMAMWYVWQFLINPAYINESLLDSVFSFYSSFINKDDFLYLYNYIPWDEKTIERTLRGEYDWEVDPKFGKNQWRMGDGHTAFIDYIYHTIAGFSEFDNFRSNQIREGLLTRDEALKLIEEDNKPRIDMLLDFSQLIGFNLEDVLLKINSVPKLY